MNASGKDALPEDPLKRLEPRRIYNPDGTSTEIGERPPEPTLLSAIFIEPVIFVGHVTLLAFSPFRRILGSDGGGESLTFGSRRASESGKRKKKGVRFYDILIALVCGIAIAALGIFPLLRMLGTEIYRSIQLSNVRRLNEVVSVTEDPTLIQAIIEQPEILNSVGENLVTSDTNRVDPATLNEELDLTSPWQEESAEFNSAEWSGALLNKFESPETEGHGRGEQE